MAGPTFSRQISLGNIIQVFVLLVAVLSGWFTLDNRVSSNTKAVADVTRLQSTSQATRSIDFKDLRIRVRTVENGLTRSDERFTRILEFMTQINSRLDTIERQR